MPADKSNGSANSSAPTATVEGINYDEAVREGKEILAKIEDAERGQLRLGELAAKVETIYSDRTLSKFAKEIGIAPCTLARYRDVYRAYEAYEDICAPGRKFSYAVLRELATLPNRAQVIRDNPKITKREAAEEVRKHKGTAKQKQDQEQADDWLKHDKRWFGNIVTSAQSISFFAEIALKCPPEKQREWLKAIEPDLVEHLRKGANRLVELVNLLDRLFEEAGEQRRAKAAANGNHRPGVCDHRTNGSHRSVAHQAHGADGCLFRGAVAAHGEPLVAQTLARLQRRTATRI
jgi:hypothetical protein